MNNRWKIAPSWILTLAVTIIPALVLQSIPVNPVFAEASFRPEFRDIEVRDFIKTMSRITRKNILIDDSVKGKVTIISYKDIPVSRAMEFMKEVLEVRGYAVVDTGTFVKVVTADAAAGQSTDMQQKPQAGGVITRVIKLPGSVNATDMQGLLRGIVDKDLKIAVYRPGNTLLLTGYGKSVERAINIVSEITPVGDGSTSEGGGDSIHIYRLKNLAADSVAQVLVRLDSPEIPGESDEAKPGQPQRTVRNNPNQKIKAVAHKESNSIVVTATPAEWSEIRSIIEKLDEQRHQVLLEVLIAEVASNKVNDFGIDWRYLGATAGHSQFNSGLATEGGLITAEGQISGINTLSGFSLGFLERGGELMGIFNANVSNQNFNVLSAPQILTLDNQEAEINVGQDVPVRTQERTSGGGTSTATVNSYDYRPSGIKLKCTPHVSAGGRISIELFTEITNIEGGQTSNSNPTFSKRNVKTYINLENKQTIVIGGLVSNEKLRAIKKIPLLGDIPLLGFIFRRTTITNKKVNLMVFITPHVLTERSEGDRISRRKRNDQIRESRKSINKSRLWPEPLAPSPERESLE